MRAFAIVAFLVPAIAFAQVPSKFGYQGKLMKSDGSSESGVVQITFSLFSAVSGGVPLWSEQQSVGLSDGFYSTALGEVAALPDGIFDGTERYLELIIGSVALTPRQKVVSVPYALVARGVAGGKVAASSVEVAGVSVVDSSGKIGWDRIKDIPGNVSSVSVAAPLSGDGKSTNPVSLGVASASADGYLAKSDWSAFGGKLGSVAVASPMTGDGKSGSPVGLPAAGSSASGYLTSADWAAFNGKLASANAVAPLTGNGTPGAPLALVPASAGFDGYLAKADWSAFDGKVSSVKAGAGVDVTGTKDATVAVKFGTAAGTSAEGNHTHLGLGNPGLNLLRNSAMLDRDADSVPDFATKDVDNSNYRLLALTDADIHAILGGSATNAAIKISSVSLRSTVSDPSPTETVSFASAIPADRAIDVPVTCSVYVRRPDSTGTNGKAKMRCFDKEVELALASTNQSWHRMSVSTRVTTAPGAQNALVVWGSGYKTGADMAYMRYALPKIEYGTSPTDWNPHDEMTVAGDWQVDGNLNVVGSLTVGQGAAFGGGVKIGADSAACASPKVGTLRFDSKWGLQACVVDKTTVGGTEYAWVAARSAPIIWSGGCSSHNTSSGWHTYCLNGTDFSTASDYLSVNTNGTVTFLRGGYYYVKFYAIQHGCGQQDIAINVTGTTRTYTHTLGDSSSSQWSHHLADLKWPFRKNDQMTVGLYHSGCGTIYNWHSWNTNGAHSRLTVEYLGPLEN